MKKPRVSPAACFIGNGKDFAFVTGGFGIARRVMNETEIFNVHENNWVAFPPMIQARASHSMVATNNKKWVYVFGGLDENNQPLNTIERVKFINIADPTKDLNTQWEPIDVQLPEALMNVGCYMIPASKDILLFGGMNDLGEAQTSGSILSIENESSHSMKEAP